MESKQNKLELGLHYTPEVICEHFEKNRIGEDPMFEHLYAEYQNDMAKVKNLREVYEKTRGPDNVGFLSEAVVYRCIEQGALGSGITARGTHVYDDYYHGADIVIESTSRQVRDPIVGTIDVTVNQENIHARDMKGYESFAHERELGFEKKIERIKKHIEYLASLKDDEAVELSAWLQRGGLLEKRNGSNERNYKEAEKLMLLKYYKNPKTSEDPDKPKYISSGPQVVISVDNLFVNRVFVEDVAKQKQAFENLNHLIQAETPLFVLLLSQYVEKVYGEAKQKGLGTNLFFASYRAACQAWVGTFSQEQYMFRVEKAIKACSLNKDTKAQLTYFQKTLQLVFES